MQNASNELNFIEIGGEITILKNYQILPQPGVESGSLAFRNPCERPNKPYALIHSRALYLRLP